MKHNEDFFTNKVIKEFKTWLIMNNCYVEYCGAVKQYYARAISPHRTDITDTEIREWILQKIQFAPEEIINLTLGWYRTPQGGKYWANKDKIWQKYWRYDRNIGNIKTSKTV